MSIIGKIGNRIMMGQSRQTSDSLTEHEEQDRHAAGYIDEPKNESYLPSSVHGSPRHMAALSKNALILVSEFGCPHIFLTPRRSKDQYKTSPKPRKGNSHDQEETEYPYYKQFPLQQCNEPGAVNLGAHAGLNNSNVNCYSNAIFQCIASCICFSDFAPSEKHPQFPLNHAFASLLSSMVGSEESVDPSLFMNVFMPLFRPLGEENINQQEGMYYDCMNQLTMYIPLTNYSTIHLPKLQRMHMSL